MEQRTRWATRAGTTFVAVALDPGETGIADTATERDVFAADDRPAPPLGNDHRLQPERVLGDRRRTRGRRQHRGRRPGGIGEGCILGMGSAGRAGAQQGKQDDERQRRAAEQREVPCRGADRVRLAQRASHARSIPRV